MSAVRTELTAATLRSKSTEDGTVRIADNERYESWYDALPSLGRQKAVEHYFEAKRAAFSNKAAGNSKAFRMRFKARKKMRCESVPWERFRYDSAAESLVLVVPYHRKPAYLPLVLPKQAGRRRALLAKLAMPSDGKTYKREEIKLLRNNHLGQYYVVVQYRHYAVPRHTADRPRVVALDPGSRTFHSYYASDGRAGELGTNRERILRHALRLDRLQSRLSKSSATSAAPAVRVSENQGDPDADGIAPARKRRKRSGTPRPPATCAPSATSRTASAGGARVSVTACPHRPLPPLHCRRGSDSACTASASACSTRRATASPTRTVTRRAGCASASTSSFCPSSRPARCCRAWRTVLPACWPRGRTTASEVPPEAHGREERRAHRGRQRALHVEDVRPVWRAQRQERAQGVHVLGVRAGRRP